MSAEKRVVRLSTKGQLVLPSDLRKRRNWDAGVALTVEETPDGVLLKSAPLFEAARPEDVFGMLRFAGPARTIEEMDASVLAEAKRRA